MNWLLGNLSCLLSVIMIHGCKYHLPKTFHPAYIVYVCVCIHVHCMGCVSHFCFVCMWSHFYFCVLTPVLSVESSTHTHTHTHTSRETHTHSKASVFAG